MLAFHDPTTRAFTRIAGLLHLVIAVAGVFSIL